MIELAIAICIVGIGVGMFLVIDFICTDNGYLHRLKNTLKGMGCNE